MSLQHLIITLCLVSAACSAADSARLSRQDSGRPLAPKEAERKRISAGMDRLKLMPRTTALHIDSPELLQVPKEAGALEGVRVAEQAPALDFVLVPLQPRYFFDPPKPDMQVGLWSIWGQGTYWPGNGKLYGAVGNHLFYEARLHLFEYEPGAKTIRAFPELNTAAGLPIEYGDGKIHGTLDFMDGPEMYFLTYWCEYPEPKPDQYRQGYEGGRLMSFNAKTRRVRDLGVPMPRVSWQYHKMDTRRGRMFAVGAPNNEFLCYDVRARKAIFAGYLPDGMRWYERCMIVDERTGCAYTSNRHPADEEVHIVRHDPEANRFTKMKCCVPHIPGAGEGNQIRAATSRALSDGAFLCISRWGRLFKFWPEEDRVQDLGSCWPAAPEKLYTTSIALSPDDRYAYYMPAAHGGAQRIGAPIVRLDTRTGEKTALCFLFPFLYEKLGYITGGTFSISTDETGARLFILMNGAFNKYDPAGGDVFGDPSVIVMGIRS